MSHFDNDDLFGNVLLALLVVLALVGVVSGLFGSLQ